MNRHSFIRTLTITLLGALAIHAAQAQQKPKSGASNKPSTAATQTRPYSVILGLGFTSGGDTLISGHYTNGDAYDIKAGNGADVKLGLEYRLTSQFALQGTVGYHTTGTSATNGDINFKRTPIELLGLYQVAEKFRLGGGLRKSTGAAINSSGVASSLGSLSFDASTGTIIQGEYLFTRKDALALRAVNESYTYGNSPTKISGNHVGIYYFHYF